MISQGLSVRLSLEIDVIDYVFAVAVVVVVVVVLGVKNRLN